MAVSVKEAAEDEDIAWTLSKGESLVWNPAVGGCTNWVSDQILLRMPLTSYLVLEQEFRAEHSMLSRLSDALLVANFVAKVGRFQSEGCHWERLDRRTSIQLVEANTTNEIIDV